MLRWLTAGESHGEALLGIMDGVPAGITITTADVSDALAQRRKGHGRGARMSFEEDKTSLLTGVLRGVTTGAPVGVMIANSEWPKWQIVMSPDPIDEAHLTIDAGKGDKREVSRNLPLTRPRPGHADLAGMLKYNLSDARPILERASARETAMKVALGEVASQILQQVAGIQLVSHVRSIGTEAVGDEAVLPTPADVAFLNDDPVRCFDTEASRRMVTLIDNTRKQGDTLGGVVEVLVYGVPLGLGSHVQADRKLDARLAGALLGVQAIKGVEIGDGFLTTRRPGSAAHDEIVWTDDQQLSRLSNRAGGIEGGMSNGQVIRVRAAMKPISTVPRALRTVDLATGEAATAIHQRSDVCAVPPAAVVTEAVVALELAKTLLELTGGDSLAQCKAALDVYLTRIAGQI